MRTELQNFENYFWGLTKDDILHTSELTKSFFKSYMDKLTLPDKELSPEIDLYLSTHYREAQFALQFGIWRLQSIFEELLKSTFKIETRQGLRKILQLLKKGGFIIPEETELLKWADLRNLISHSAPEWLHPSPTNFVESDIDEYSSLLIRIYDNLNEQVKS